MTLTSNQIRTLNEKAVCPGSRPYLVPKEFITGNESEIVFTANCGRHPDSCGKFGPNEACGLGSVSVPIDKIRMCGKSAERT